MRLREVAEQPRLAHARIADQHDRASLLPRVFQRSPLASAPDQLWWARNRWRHGPRHAARQLARALDQLREFARFDAGFRFQFAPEQLLAARIGGQRRGAIATPVVQPHQQPVRLLGQRIFGDQPLGVDQRAGEMSARFLVRQGGGDRIAAQNADPLTRATDPVIEFFAVLVAERAEQLAGSRRGISRKPRRQRSEVVIDALGQRECRIFDDDIAPRAAPQSEQSLAQAVAGLSAAPHRATASRRRGRAVSAHRPRAGPAARHPCVRAQSARRCPAPVPAPPASAGGSPPMPRRRARPAPRDATSSAARMLQSMSEPPDRARSAPSAKSTE